jgi:hypothetical protein
MENYKDSTDMLQFKPFKFLPWEDFKEECYMETDNALKGFDVGDGGNWTLSVFRVNTGVVLLATIETYRYVFSYSKTGYKEACDWLNERKCDIAKEFCR